MYDLAKIIWICTSEVVRISHLVKYVIKGWFIPLSDNRNSIYINGNSFIENLAALKYSMWALRGKKHVKAIQLNEYANWHMTSSSSDI